MNDPQHRTRQMQLGLEELEAYERMATELEARDAFDLRYGTNTQQPVEVYHMQGLDLTADVLRNNHRYAPTPIRTVERMLSGIHVEYEQSTFVDFGAGKGRVLLVASRFPWRRVIGVEASPELCSIAIANCRLYQTRQTYSVDVEVQCVDAAAFEIPPDATVFYFFDPFSEDVMRRVLVNIALSLEQHHRRAHCLLVGRRLSALFEEHPGFELVAKVPSPDHATFDGFIYSNRIAACIETRSTLEDK